MSDILDDLDSPWPADYALQPKNSSERFDVIHAQEVKRQAADEIRGLREQVAALEADRDDWIACHAKIFRELQETKTLVGNKCEEVAALAEQNEKMREALRAASQYLPVGVVHIAEAALSLPDLATTAINRFKREGMLDAAEICKQIEEEKWRDWRAGQLGGVALTKTYGSARCAQAIRARADELTKEVKG